MNKDPYIQTLQQTPVASQLENVNDSNTLLNLNTGTAKAQVLENTPEAAVRQIEEQQSAYNDRLVHAFSDSLHRIFMITASLMFLALVLSFFLKERPLRAAKADETPGL